MAPTKVGDCFKSNLNGARYVVRKIKDRLVFMETPNGKSQVLTELSGLKLFYKRVRCEDLTGIADQYGV